MSERAKEALDEWLAGIAVTGASPADRSEAEEYRDNLVIELSDDGITEAELESAADGDLVGYILSVLGRGKP